MKTKRNLHRSLSILLCVVMMLSVLCCAPFSVSAETTVEQADTDIVAEVNQEQTQEKAPETVIEKEEIEIETEATTDSLREDKSDVAGVGAVPYDVEYDGVRYDINEKGALEIVSYNPETLKEHVVIPSYIDGKPVTAVRGKQFYSPFDDAKLKSIVLPPTVTLINWYSFACCYDLESVTIQGEIKGISANTFYNSNKLVEVNLPDSVEHIGEEAFYDCTSLKSIKLPKNLKTIGEYAFVACSSLETVIINPALEKIDVSAFRGLKNLTDVIFEGGNTNLKLEHSAFAGCTNLKNFDFSCIKTIGDSAFAGCEGLTSVNFGAIKGSTLGQSSFSRCKSLETVTLTSQIKTIPKGCFSECTSLKTVTMPGVTRLGPEAFNKCSSIEKIDLTKVTYVDYNVFRDCTSLADVTFSESGECFINYGVFCNCISLKSVKLSSKTTQILASTFKGCTALESVEAKNMTKIGNYAFSGCENLKKLSFATSNKIEEVGECAFYNCIFLTKIYLPYVTRIRCRAFENCYNLYKVEIGEKLHTMEEMAFLNCYSLSQIYFPESLDYIGEYACACLEEPDGMYVFTEFKVLGTKDSLADEYADLYGIKWALPAPKLSSVKNTSDGIKITFKHIAGTSGGVYRIYRKTASTSWTKVADVTGTTYTDKTAKAGTKYTYTVKYVGKPKNSAYDIEGLTTVRMKTPSVSKITNTTDGAKLSWSKVEGAAKYRVYVKSGSSWKKVGDTTTTSFTHTAAKSGTSYTYTVKAYDGSGDYVSAYNSAGWSNKFIATPGITKVANTVDGAKITWGKVTGAAKYRVFVKSGSSWKKLGDTTSTSYTHKSAESGKTYTYTVRCISSTGKSYVSGYDTAGVSNMFLATPKVSKISNTVDGAKITWGKVSGAAKYNIYVKSGSGWKKLGESTTTSFVHTTAKSGTTYYYRVRAYDSTAAYTSSYKTAGDSNKFIAAPVISSLENTSKGVKISWGKVSGAVNYRVFVKSGSSWEKLGDTTSTTFTHKAAKAGTTYTYTVRCISSTGKSYVSGYDTVGKAITFEK